MISIPNDSILLPTHGGGLIVSPSYGIYCAVLLNEYEIIKKYLDECRYDLVSDVPAELVKRLKEHGFGGQPRPYKREWQLLQFQITNACNLSCTYCHAASGRARPNELTLGDVKRVVDESLDIYPDTTFSFSGGEPLLVPWLFDAIDYISAKCENDIGLLSNLLLIKNDDNLLDRCIKFINDGYQLRMSMSGTDKEVCNRLSGKECYDDAIEILHLFKKKGVLPELDLMMSASDAQANIDSFAAFRRSLPEKTKLTFALMYPCGRETGKHCFDNEDDKERMMDEIAFEGGISIKAPSLSPVTHRRKGCRCIENKNLYIRSDGEVYTCFKLTERIGHVSEGMRAIVERRDRMPLAADIEPCRSCPFVSLCANGCSSENAIFQSMYQGEPICGPWRKRLIADMLFEDKPYIFEWPLIHQMSEAKKRGLYF